MYSLMANCFAWLKRRKDPARSITLVVIGLDDAGKTTMVASLQGEPPDGITPTIGFANAELTISNFKVTVYDLGGGVRIRDVWRKYYSEVFGIVFVVDSYNGQRLGESKDVLHEVLKHEKITGKPILIFANKKDKEGALQQDEIRNALELEELSSVHEFAFKIVSCSALKGYGRNMDKNINTGFQWLLSTISSEFSKISARVENDVKIQKEEDEREKKARIERIRKIREERDRLEREAGNDPDKEESEDDGRMENPFQPIGQHLENLKAKEKKKKKGEKEKEKVAEPPKEASDVINSNTTHDGPVLKKKKKKKKKVVKTVENGTLNQVEEPKGMTSFLEEQEGDFNIQSSVNTEEDGVIVKKKKKKKKVVKNRENDIEYLDDRSKPMMSHETHVTDVSQQSSLKDEEDVVIVKKKKAKKKKLKVEKMNEGVTEDVIEREQDDIVEDIENLPAAARKKNKKKKKINNLNEDHGIENEVLENHELEDFNNHSEIREIETVKKNTNKKRKKKKKNRTVPVNNVIPEELHEDTLPPPAWKTPPKSWGSLPPIGGHGDSHSGGLPPIQNHNTKRMMIESSSEKVSTPPSWTRIRPNSEDYDIMT